MPLCKRLESEMCSEWREQALCYMDLQHKAEELVGNDDEEQEAVFKFHAEFAMEQASEFYDKKVKELQAVFDEVALCVGGVHDLHKDREKSAVSKITSPSTSTEYLWTLPEDKPPAQTPEDEDKLVMQQCFAIWRQDTDEKPGRTSLANFVGEGFLLTLEESALKDALREFLQMLVYIDRIRNFALLNSIVVIKVAQRHCSSKIDKGLIAALHELPMFQMKEINAMVPEMENLAHKLHQKLSGSTINELPSSWSLHVCPFCSHTATNAVVLPIGRTCCWQCAAGSATNAMIYCPLTGKPMDIKELRLERVLASFLRRFFPAALKDAPAPLIGTIEDVVAHVPSEAASIGILAALKSPNLRPQHMCRSKATTPSRRQLRLTEEMRPASLEMEKLDLEVSAILKGLASPKSSGAGKGKTMCTDSPNLLPLRRRERSCSEPCEPPSLDTLFLGGPLMLVAPGEHVIEPRNLRGFPLCAAGCWCIERQAAVCLDLSQAAAF